MALEVKLAGKGGPSQQHAFVGTTIFRNIGAYYDSSDSKLKSSDASSNVLLRKNTTAYKTQFYTSVAENIELGATPTSETELIGTDFYVRIAGVDILQATTAGVSGPTAPFVDGSAAVPSISFTNQTNTGFYRIGADNLGISLGGIKQLDFAVGDFKFIADNNGTTTVGQLTVRGTTNTNKYLTFGLDTTNNLGFIEAGIEGTGYNDIAINHNASSNILIGTTSNTYSTRLFVNGTVGANNTMTLKQGSSSSPSIRFNSSTNTGIYYSSGLHFCIGGTNILDIISTEVSVPSLKLKASTSGNTVELKSAGSLSASYSLTLPNDVGTQAEYLTLNGSGICDWLDPYFGLFGFSTTDTTLGADLTLTTNSYYRNITISGAFGIITNNWKLFISGTLTINTTTSTTGVIRCNGSNGNNGAAAATGGTVGTAMTAGAFAVSTATAGGAGTTTTGTQAAAVSAVTSSLGGPSGAGGAGGLGSGGAGGASRAGRTPTRYHLHHSITDLVFDNSVAACAVSGPGGSGAGGANPTAGAGGGAGGTCGGVVMVFANIIQFTGTSVSPIFASYGGNGGNGGTTVTTNCGGGGGGAGGGAGAVILICGNIIGTPPSGWLYLASGAGGNGGNGLGTGIGGAGGASGGVRRMILYTCIERNVQATGLSLAADLAPVAGSAASGVTGGSGSTRQTLSLSTF